MTQRFMCRTHAANVLGKGAASMKAAARGQIQRAWKDAEEYERLHRWFLFRQFGRGKSQPHGLKRAVVHRHRCITVNSLRQDRYSTFKIANMNISHTEAVVSRRI